MKVDDPYDLGREVLDNTPWWVPGFDNRRGTERSLGFCDPFGYETGDVRVMGGTRKSENESYLWQCRNYAQGRYVMTCANGHKGFMRLCYGHVYNISSRMSGICPGCAMPPRARELEQKCFELQAAWAQAWPDERRRIAIALEDARREMDEMRERGIISTGAPLRLTEVS